MPDVSVSDLSPEDAKLVALAKGSRSRINAAQGAALRDETGRTYASASVSLAALPLTAIQAVVAQAVAAGARAIEAVVLVSAGSQPDSAGMTAVRELGGKGVTVMAISDGGDDVATYRT